MSDDSEKTGSSYSILELCEFRFCQFSGASRHVFVGSAQNFIQGINLATWITYLSVNETGNRNKKIELEIIPVSFSVSTSSIDLVRSSSVICVEFVSLLGNVIDWCLETAEVDVQFRGIRWI